MRSFEVKYLLTYLLARGSPCCMLTAYTHVLTTYYRGVVEAICATSSQPTVPAPASYLQYCPLLTTYYCSPGRAWRQWWVEAGA